MENNSEHETIEREYETTVEAENVEMTQACAVNVMADQVKMDQSCAAVVKADTVHMDNSFALILSSENPEGDVKALLSPTTALIAGGIVLLGFLLWRRR